MHARVANTQQSIRPDVCRGPRRNDGLALSYYPQSISHDYDK